MSEILDVGSYLVLATSTPPKPQDAVIIPETEAKPTQSKLDALVAGTLQCTSSPDCDVLIVQVVAVARCSKGKVGAMGMNDSELQHIAGSIPEVLKDQP
ncbi:hypothetical protein [Deinococcus misasensis]|uniref:hypothetical protein n=1 Tax=Deinococcus misasensis TaxID=392413 RepID=UPI00054F6C3D|nr:hypothetical protein [Deinococcus misasensis]